MTITKWKIEESLFDYDGVSHTLTIKDDNEKLYFLHLAQEGIYQWTYFGVEINQETLDEIKNEKIDIRGVLDYKPAWVVHVNKFKKEYRVLEMNENFRYVFERYMPQHGVFLYR